MPWSTSATTMHQSRCITKDRLAHFIQFYILVMSHLVNNDKDKWIYTFFKQAREKPKLKHVFTMSSWLPSYCMLPPRHGSASAMEPHSVARKGPCRVWAHGMPRKQ